MIIKINRKPLEPKSKHSVDDSSDKPVGEGGEVISSSLSESSSTLQNRTLCPTSTTKMVSPNDLSDKNGNIAHQPEIDKCIKDGGGRHFCNEWYKRFDWLKYSVEKDAVFCFPCRVFGNTHPGATKLTVEGYSNWKHAVGDNTKSLNKHGNSIVHNAAVNMWISKKVKLQNSNSVSLIISSDVLDRRRYYVHSIAEIVQFLAVNELAFRGDYDLQNQEEKGLFINLFNFTASKVSKLAAIAKEIPQNANFKSPDIQNDVINELASMVSEMVARDVIKSDTGKMTLLADGCRNKANVENISVVCRCVKDGVPHESLFKMPSSDALDTKSLKSVLLDTIEEYKLTERVVAQCYDGATSMSGSKDGVPRLIQNELGRVIPYAHCFNHRYHLVIVALIGRITFLRSFFDQIGLLYEFFKKFKVDRMCEGTSFKRVFDTRWSAHYDSTCAIIGNYKHIIATLSTIVDGDRMFETEDVVTAIGLLNILRTESFCFNAIIMQKILGLVKPVDSEKNRETDLTKALASVESTAKVMKNLRNDSACEEQWMATVKLRESAEFTEQTEESNGRPDSSKRCRKITAR